MGIKYTNTNDSFDKVKNRGMENPIKKDKDFFLAKGDSFLLKNEYRKAVKEYLVSLMMDKNSFKAHKGASIAYKKLKKYNKAIKHLKDARNVYSFDSDIYYELGLNYLLMADSENAQKNFIRTIKLCPENKNAQIKLALTHEFSGEKEMAIMVYKTIIEKNPEFIPAYSNLASVYIEDNDFEKAIGLFKKALEINAQYYRAFLGLGLCFDKMKQYSRAIRYYKKYIAHKPKSDVAKSLIGRIYEIHIRKSKQEKNLKLIQ